MSGDETFTVEIQDRYFETIVCKEDCVEAEFDAFEDQAELIAENGTDCCVIWGRLSDGQAGFYGPWGVEIKPYWYESDTSEF